MFPPRRQQGLMLAIAAVGVALAWALLPTAQTIGGFAILFADHPVRALFSVVIWAVAVGALAAICGAAGNPLAAAAVLGLTLMTSAVGAGSIDGWIRRAGGAGDYFWLAVEMAIWAGLIAAVLAVGWAGRAGLRRRLPGWLRFGHYHEVDEADQSRSLQAAAALAPLLIAAAVIFALDRAMVSDFVACLLVALVLLLVLWAVTLGSGNLRGGRAIHELTPSVTTAFLAATVAVTIGQGLLFILMRSEDVGQVVGALIVAFAIATLIAHQMYPTAARLPLLLSPLIVGAGAYLWTAGSIDGQVELLARFFVHYSEPQQPALLPPARALPVHYASAGLLGAAIGLGWSQGIHAAGQKHVVLAGA